MDGGGAIVRLGRGLVRAGRGTMAIGREERECVSGCECVSGYECVGAWAKVVCCIGKLRS